MDPLLDHEKRLVTLEKEVRVFAQQSRGSRRRALSADLVLYVRADGNDSNTGRGDSADKAFSTIQAAVNAACHQYESGLYSITIRVQDGTWVLPSTLILGPHLIAGGVVLQGNTSNPLACILQRPAAGWLMLQTKPSPGPWTLNALNMGRQSTGYDINTVILSDYAWMHVQNCNFGNAGNGTHLYASGFSQIKTTGPITISGGAYRHALADWHSLIDIYGGAYTLTGTPTFVHWAEGYRKSTVRHQASATVSGASTVSLRYYLQWHSMAEGIGNMPGTGGTADATSVAV